MHCSGPLTLVEWSAFAQPHIPTDMHNELYHEWYDIIKQKYTKAMECTRDLEGRPQYCVAIGILAKEREETLRTMRHHNAPRSQEIMRSVLRVTGERLHFIVEHSRPRYSSPEPRSQEIMRSVLRVTGERLHFIVEHNSRPRYSSPEPRHLSVTDDRNQEQGTISDREWWNQIHMRRTLHTDDRNQEQGTISDEEWWRQIHMPGNDIPLISSFSVCDP
jgi:hypothetical protein